MIYPLFTLVLTANHSSVNKENLDTLLQQLGTEIPRDSIKEEQITWTFDKSVYFAMTCVTTIGESNIGIWMNLIKEVISR